MRTLIARVQGACRRLSLATRTQPHSLLQTRFSTTTEQGEGEDASSKPRAPPDDLCCGEGCESCVWLQYLDDLEQYYRTRTANGDSTTMPGLVQHPSQFALATPCPTLTSLCSAPLPSSILIVTSLLSCSFPPCPSSCSFLFVFFFPFVDSSTNSSMPRKGSC